MTIDTYREQQERDRIADQQLKESEAQLEAAGAEYDRKVLRLAVLLVIIFALFVCWATPSAGGDAAYQSYAIEQVTR